MSKRYLRRLLWSLLLLFALINVMAFFHAWKFTHFKPGITLREDPSKVSFPAKLRILFTGVDLPRPVTKKHPQRPFREFVLQSNKKLDCWEMLTDSAKGTIVLFHGYGGEKSDMLERAYVFLDAGYNVLLPDLMGAGGSEGNQCTIGYKEAENVKTCVDYLVRKKEQRIYLLGSSMGAAAVMRACSLYKMPLKAVILECPFGSMRQTVKNRFAMVGVPAFPLSDLLLFWGGVQNGFNAFRHNPETYATRMELPVLLLCGGKDDRVMRFETDSIFAHLPAEKKMVIYPLAGHESYLNKYREPWTNEVCRFLRNHP